MSNQNIAAVNKEGCSGTVSAENKSITIRYEECNKNHGARLGKNATDGCKEFMASNLDLLKCDACGCHRNFHRKRTVNDDGAKASSEVRHEDCCKNHALQYGKYSSTDGCLEFMAGEGDEGSRDVLMCDACGCHRNFHKKREEEEEKGVRRRASPPSYGGAAAYDSDEYYD